MLFADMLSLHLDTFLILYLTNLTLQYSILQYTTISHPALGTMDAVK